MPGSKPTESLPHSRPASRPTSRPPSRRPSFSHLSLHPLSQPASPTLASFPTPTTPSRGRGRRPRSIGPDDQPLRPLSITEPLFTPYAEQSYGQPTTPGGARSGMTTPRKSYISSFTTSPERGRVSREIEGREGAEFHDEYFLEAEEEESDSEGEEEWGGWLQRVFGFEEEGEEVKREEEWGLWEEALWWTGWGLLGGKF